MQQNPQNPNPQSVADAPPVTRKQTAKDIAREEQLANLRHWYPKGSTVYTILRGVSRSGMQRTIGLLAIIGPDDLRHPNYAAATVLGYRQDKHTDGLKVSGGGMDMGFHLAYNLSHALYGDGYALNHRWL